MANRPLMAHIGDGVWWAPLGAFSTLIFFISSRENPLRIPKGLFEFDKILHIGTYGVWGLLCAAPVLRSWPAISAVRLIVIVGIAGSLYGLSDEIHQAYVPRRQAAVGDLLADALGAFAGAAAAAVVWRRWRRGREAVDSCGRSGT